ncbi:unnamed protein product [Closterium sp. NIES-64]|nr:unnamed protein product [Closterium sp. NIES-64]
MCAFIVWLMKANVLPEATPSVLSQVAFQALIPCFMMTKVASTLSVQPLSSLAFLPLLAVFQILCGLVLGKLACTIAYRRPSSLPSPPSARHIAFSVAQSIGLSPSAAALLSGLPFPQRDGGEEGAAGGEKVVPGRGVLSAPGMVGAAERAAGRKESVVMAACAFGNSLTLPLVFLATLLTRADADRAAGYLALFMVGGSTAFWTLGYSMFRGGSNAQEEGDEEGVEGSAAAKMEATAAAAAAMGMTGFERAASRVMEMAKKVLNPPIYGERSHIPELTGSQKTGSQKTGSQKTGSQKTGSQKTGSQKTYYMNGSF